MIKALFFDIDGTLVSFRTHNIPPSTVDALQKAHDKGIKVFIATGRPRVLINNMSQLENAGIINGYVTLNGAYCFVEDDLVFSSPISHESAVTIGRYAEAHHVPCIFVPAHGIRACNPDTLMEEVFYKHLHADRIPETTFEEGWDGDIYQITAFFTQSEEEEALRNVTDVNSNRWHPSFTDLTNAVCDKRSGVERMATHFGFNKDEVMCFGDGGNDIPMIAYASIGVALGNADNEVKSHADYVTTDVDNDGIANALKHFHII